MFALVFGEFLVELFRTSTFTGSSTRLQALFKARFEQALESQKLNIKKYEQELRRKGINPNNPTNITSIQRVADADDSDQEEIDQFIAEIENAADKEFAQEEGTEKEEVGRIMYLNRDNLGGKYVGSEMVRGEKEYDSDDDQAPTPYRVERGQKEGSRRGDRNDSFRRNVGYKGKLPLEDYGSDSALSDVDDAMWHSDIEEEIGSVPSTEASNFKSSSDEEEDSLHEDRYKSNDGDFKNNHRRFSRNEGINPRGNIRKVKYEPEEELSELEIKIWESDDEEELSRFQKCSTEKNGNDGEKDKNMKSPKPFVQTWDSD